MVGSRQDAGGAEEPVFVLCGSRSGSTLLRFVLDAHPELACPPETRLPWLCWELTQAWSVLAGITAPVPGGDMSLVPEPVIAGVRQSLDPMISSHLGRHGKARFCDKTGFSAPYAGILLRVYPPVRFLCLYRHPMDFIASGLEACPWGLKDFGFDSYAAADPGNMLAALGRCWADFTEQVMAAEQRFPDCCYRVRYEDLVTAPEQVAEAVFGFLGAAPAPGITDRCFSLDRDRSGPGDYKIWGTARVTTGSLGRGWKLPAHLFPAPLRDRLNALAARLGYVPIDENWGQGEAPADLRAQTPAGSPVDAPADPRPAAVAPDGTGPAGPPPGGTRLLADRVQASLARLDEGFTRSWPSYSAERLLLIAAAPASAGGPAWWRLDLAASTIATGRGEDAGAADWSVRGSAQAWHDVLSGATNLAVAFRRDELRYRVLAGADPGSPAAIRRVAMLADLLDIARWEPAAPTAENGHPPSGRQQPGDRDASPPRPQQRPPMTRKSRQPVTSSSQPRPATTASDRP